MSTATSRMPAAERRQAIIAVAIREFAAGGYTGTSAEVIARRAGVSQPYLFQIFKTKKELFLAAVRSGFERSRHVFEEEGTRARVDGLDPTSILQAMGGAYRLHLGDRGLLRLQLQAYAACDDAEIRVTVADEFRVLYETVKRVSGADDVALEAWFGTGMLWNVLAAIGQSNQLEQLSLAAVGRTRPT